VAFAERAVCPSIAFVMPEFGRWPGLLDG